MTYRGGVEASVPGEVVHVLKHGHEADAPRQVKAHQHHVALALHLSDRM
jgi:hypothetical protein